jgi:predicted nucleic acid-binding protein
MRIVFLDTVGLIALWDDRDQWHQSAAMAYQRLLTDRSVLITTDAVLLECGNVASRLRTRPIVSLFRRSLMEDRRLVLPDAREIEAAWTAYQNGSTGDPGIVDQISFQVMKRYSILEVFSNDRHFKTAGFVTLF